MDVTRRGILGALAATAMDILFHHRRGHVGGPKGRTGAAIHRLFTDRLIVHGSGMAVIGGTDRLAIVDSGGWQMGQNPIYITDTVTYRLTRG